MIVATPAQFTEAIHVIANVDRLVVDLETTGIEPYHGSVIFSVAVYVPDVDRSYYFPFRHQAGGNLPIELLQFLLFTILDHDKHTTGWNYKFDLQFMVMELDRSVEVPPHVYDGMIAAHLINENEPSLALKKIAAKYLGEEAVSDERALIARLKELKAGKDEMSRLTPEEVAPYAESDVILTHRLMELYIPALKKRSMYDLFLDMCRYLQLITRMEMHGLMLDTSLLKEYQENAIQEIHALEDNMQLAAGKKLNFRSSKQMQAWLGMESTRAAVLEEVASVNPNAAMLHEHRMWQKVLGSYYDVFGERMDSDGVIRPNFNITRVYTGRLSCSSPNLQAIPRQSNIYRVKDLIIARPDHTIVKSDYSQAEIRVASYYAKEERMLKLLEAGADIHGVTAERLGIDRQYAKRLNFSVIYGIGAKSLSVNLRVSQEEARRYLNAYHAEYPGFRRLYEKAQRFAEENGHITLFTGRRRHYNVATAAKHKASSNLIQGTVAEIVRLAMLKLDVALSGSGVHQLLNIHDEIMFEVPDKVLFDVMPIIKQGMEEHPFLSLKADLSYGKVWSQTVDWEPNI